MYRNPRWISLVVMAVLLGSLWYGMRSAVSTARADEEGSGQVASLKDQLEKGLRARRSVEFQFLARVAQLVDSGALSRELVQGSFSWTTRKYRDRKTLVPYFEQHLRLRAAQAGNTSLNTAPTTLPRT